METRGRLSSLDLAPEEAQDDIVWALGELNARTRSQADILFELNDRLAVKGVDKISKSAFNRKAVRLAAMQARRAEARELYAAIGADLSAQGMDEASVVIGELIKTLLTELLDEGARTITPTGAMEIAQAYVKTVQGQTMSAALRTKLEKDFAEKTGAAIDKAVKAKGLSAETAAGIKAQILGLKQE